MSILCMSKVLTMNECLKCFVSAAEETDPQLFQAAFEQRWFDIRVGAAQSGVEIGSWIHTSDTSRRHNVTNDKVTIKVYARCAHTRSKSFWVVAGFGRVPKELRAPGYRDLSDNFCGLYDYMGGVIWSKTSGFQEVHEDVLGLRNIFDAKNQITVLNNKTGTHYQIRSEFYKNSPLSWLGVIDVKTDGSVNKLNIYFDEVAQRSSLIPYRIRENTDVDIYPHFEIHTGRLVVLLLGCVFDEFVGEPRLKINNVRDGKWFVSIKRLDEVEKFKQQFGVEPFCIGMWHANSFTDISEIANECTNIDYPTEKTISERMENRGRHKYDRKSDELYKKKKTGVCRTVPNYVPAATHS